MVGPLGVLAIFNDTLPVLSDCVNMNRCDTSSGPHITTKSFSLLFLRSLSLIAVCGCMTCLKSLTSWLREWFAREVRPRRMTIDLGIPLRDSGVCGTWVLLFDFLFAMGVL